MVKGQQADGSWMHGLDAASNPASYKGLVATTSMAIQGMGMARREGATVDPKAIERAVGYIEASTKGGHIGYSPRSGEKGIKGPGRTAGGLLALMAVGQQKHAIFERADEYLRKHFANATVTSKAIHTLQGGHASAQMGLAWAAWYAGATGTYEDF